MRGGGRRDLPATAAAHFTDVRSYVRIDGKRFLFGDDLTQLRRAVFERDKYTCWGDIEDGLRCGKTVTWDTGHLHHIIPRGRGGSDEMSNTVTLCPDCHAKLHVRPRLRWMRETA